ncbi:hypothetical protein [Sinorhizobium fredii]|uniref:Uncharacterized protein n=1 Tax=Rhizobium fredii TaxID=380 RepID=A0A844AA50_RHIFR|nr:hypothetical protein [Sinorhizobium fredii]MQX09211.1 hypothetical protein [Sinorhizobium fredii]GEC30656.1 hypothetical protein EFR01_08270 [Sinorhizobium fredii]GLS06591.1 hypothetical protein GCM10007864_02160 [Sinorhizobium fredii]
MAKKKKKITYNFAPNALFKGGESTELNACVGSNGGPYDLIDYGKGFFDGAQEIIKAVRNGAFYVDVLVYPVCFSFRHGIELYLKALVKSSITFNGSDRVYGKNHSIDEYWKMIVEEFEKFDDRVIDKSEIATVTPIINDFVQIDPTGQVFRYPEDIAGNAHLDGLGLINLDVLSEGMTVLHALLENWYYRIEGILEYRRDGF